VVYIREPMVQRQQRCVKNPSHRMTCIRNKIWMLIWYYSRMGPFRNWVSDEKWAVIKVERNIYFFKESRWSWILPPITTVWNCRVPKIFLRKLSVQFYIHYLILLLKTSIPSFIFISFIQKTAWNKNCTSMVACISFIACKRKHAEKKRISPQITH
jgi:hypothetical protein